MNFDSICTSHEALPEDKLDIIKQLQEKNGHALMVGDGINDSAAMACAAASCATYRSSDLTRTSADCVLMNEDMCNIQRLRLICNKVDSTIKFNIIWAAMYNFTAIPLAISGHLSPWMAAIGMSLSSIIVVLNSTRLLNYRPL